MSETELLNSVYILDLNHYTEFCDIFKSSESLNELYLLCGLHGFNVINLEDKNWLEHPLRKTKNIILLPFKHDCLGWCLTPWQIIKCQQDKTMLHCKWSLEMRQFNWRSVNTWKESGLRRYLNSDNFSNKFSDVVRTKVCEYDVWTDEEVVKDKFWLLSREELGKTFIYDLNTQADFKSTENNKSIVLNGSIFNSRASRKKIYIENIKYLDNDSKDNNILTYNNWWLRSKGIGQSIQRGLVTYEGYIGYYYADAFYGVSPAFVLGC